MFNRNILAALMVTGAVLTPMSALANESKERPDCILNQHRVISVRAYKVDQHVGRAMVQRLKGAEIRVQAEPGLTKEWLELTLRRHLTAMHGTSMKDCVLDVDKIRVTVDSTGTGFSVKLIANDSDDAKEVLRRAMLLM